MFQILHVGDQIDILRGWLTKVFPRRAGRSGSVITAKDVIKKHQKIIALSQSIEHLYSYVAMELFLSDTIIMCSLGFILVIVSKRDESFTKRKTTEFTRSGCRKSDLPLTFQSLGRPDAWVIIMRTLLFYFIMSLEAFAFCFAGEYLSTKVSFGPTRYLILHTLITLELKSLFTPIHRVKLSEKPRTTVRGTKRTSKTIDSSGC